MGAVELTFVHYYHLESNNVVVVPPVEVPHRELCLQQLSRYNVDPLEDDNNYGITMYRQALDILS